MPEWRSRAQGAVAPVSCGSGTASVAAGTNGVAYPGGTVIPFTVANKGPVTFTWTASGSGLDWSIGHLQSGGAWKGDASGSNEAPTGSKATVSLDPGAFLLQLTSKLALSVQYSLECGGSAPTPTPTPHPTPTPPTPTPHPTPTPPTPTPPIPTPPIPTPPTPTPPTPTPPTPTPPTPTPPTPTPPTPTPGSTSNGGEILGIALFGTGLTALGLYLAVRNRKR
jgi:hypothetical protein